MPSRMAGSLSMTSTRSPDRTVAAGFGGSGAAAVAGSAATTGTSTRNTDPRPASEFNVIGCLSTRPMRSTMERPRPRPRATFTP